MRPHLAFAVAVLGLSGCTMFEWLAPHQFWKLNRQPALGRDDSYFSIPAEDPTATAPKSTVIDAAGPETDEDAAALAKDASADDVPEWARDESRVH